MSNVVPLMSSVMMACANCECTDFELHGHGSVWCSICHARIAAKWSPKPTPAQTAEEPADGALSPQSP